MADAEEEEVVEEKKSGNLMQIIIVVLLVLILATGGFIAWKVMQEPEVKPADTAPSQTEETKIPEPEPEDPNAVPVLINIDNITVNLADANESRFLRTKVTLELRSEADKTLLSSDAGKAKINDLIITILSSKTFKDIRTAQGKYELKEEMIFRMNKEFPGKPVKKLYFTDFVSQ